MKNLSIVTLVLACSNLLANDEEVVQYNYDNSSNNGWYYDGTNYTNGVGQYSEQPWYGSGLYYDNVWFDTKDDWNRWHNDRRNEGRRNGENRRNENRSGGGGNAGHNK